jgi:CubicO group peptidase (beta-lactamase class C family)
MFRHCNVAILLFLICISTCSADAFEWQSEKPEAHGFDPAKLAAWRATLEAHHTDCLLVVRHDKVILEWYADGWTADKPHGTASLAKAMIGGVSLTLAMQDGRLSPDDPASKFIPQWRNDPRKSRITIAQLATHSSGVQDAEMDGIAHDKLPGWMADFWARKPDPFTIARDQAPIIFEPGTKFQYSNPGMAMLSYAITASYQGSQYPDVRTLLRRRVMRPIGISDREWSAGYGTTYEVDGLKLVANWGGAAFTPRAAARVGRLMLRKGDWDGQRILDAPTIDRVLSYDKAPRRDDHKEDPSPNPGLAWWTNIDRAWKQVPPDAFGGAGAGNQVLLVIPSLDLILVRNGQNLFDPKAGENFWSGIEKYLFNPLMAARVDAPGAAGASTRGVQAMRSSTIAFNGQPKNSSDNNITPFPPSPLIRSVTFAPVSSIRREALDSDNWPITWADDDALYTSYGDGHGFEPYVKEKLSMGFARIQGAPENFRAMNIRSDGERSGNGAKGAKASGLLCIDGTLYMWVRNTNNATLAWSTDHARTWTFGFTISTSFAAPTFLNCGRDNASAPDSYVYTFSQDNDTAYEPADGVVLARVSKQHIKDRAAWEFFAGADGSSARWSSNISDRKPIITYPSHCERTDAVYDAPLKRYLLTLGLGHGKGWALLDAPTPYGPWTRAFIADAWDIPDTHGYRLPSKWISADGQTLWLVFSGLGDNDALCLRKMTLQVK